MNYWLGNLIKPLHDDTTAMVYGRQLGARSSNFSEAQDMRRTFGKQRRVLRPPRFFANNANSAVRKDLWRQHPFDEGLLGLEDIEWAKYWMKRQLSGCLRTPGRPLSHTCGKLAADPQTILP